ncbi:MAG: hypothetical protein B0D92_01035 [Spirochaeta sp. LUC14_002_19_P3]|nr:MAG: hypothetical protein B0D92_01035 [Spirochaeta sp. LUC14_002_19_P3]
MNADINKLLRSSKMFSDFHPADIAIMKSLSEEYDYADGETVFQAGDSSSQFFIILEGVIAIRSLENKTHQVDIARYLAGDCVGELDFFTKEPRSASAVAIGATKLLAFPHTNSSLSDIIQKLPQASAHLIHGFLAHFSSRIRKANTFVKSNSLLVRELKKQVYVDKLTGLLNRINFEESLKSILDKNAVVGLLMYKVDNFKRINDEYGHEIGDKMLQYIAENLSSAVPDTELLFRYAGNENAVILPEASRNTLWDSGMQIGNFLRKLDLTPVLGETNIALSISVGLTLSPDHGNEAKNLIESAHALTLEGRRRGGNLTLFPEDSDKL